MQNTHLRRAISVVFTCKSEVFYITRQHFLKAFPGYTAFPGGKVDACDKCENEDETLQLAMEREVKEELNISIVQLQSEDKVRFVKKIAKATSPDFNPLRFETYFFQIELKEKINFQVDANEAKEYGWRISADIVKEYNEGKRLMVFPVKHTFERLSDGKIEYQDYDITRSQEGIPKIENLVDIKQYMPLSHTVPPATRTNAFVIGDIIIDPSPKDEAEFEKLIDCLQHIKLCSIVLTHHHGDHHQYSVDLAERLSLNMMMSEDSFNRILTKWGKDYFRDIEISYIKEGDSVTTWQKEKVIAYQIPGHDEGHIGLAPASMKWFIVGDLFQGIGTVVVGGEEGDMVKYFSSLEKVIKLNPNCVIPSHGIPLGGVHILEKTLQHRKMREEQVFELTQKGYSIDEILKKIYFDIPAKVLKYARANIESHLKKLQDEKRL